MNIVSTAYYSPVDYLGRKEGMNQQTNYNQQTNQNLSIDSQPERNVRLYWKEKVDKQTNKMNKPTNKPNNPEVQKIPDNLTNQINNFLTF